MIAEISDINKLASAIALEQFQILRKELVDKYDELGMRASGNWERNLHVIQSLNSTRIDGEEYTNEMVRGVKPNKGMKRQELKDLVESLKQWIQDKGIVSNLSVTSLAWAIAIKMKKEGSKYYREGGTDLISSVITTERIQQIINKVGIEVALNIVPIFTNTFKTINDE